MKFVKATLIVLALSMFGTFVVPSVRAQAQVGNDKTVITFSQPFEIPGGQVLPAGTYTFSLFDSTTSRRIVQVFSADGTKLIATILAINNYRFRATDQTVMFFSERPADAPEALKAWFYPGNNWGTEFVYPKQRAIQLAIAEKEPVPALTTDTVPAAVAELRSAPIIAITPEQKEVPVAEAIQTTPEPVLVAQNRTSEPLAQELPQTASLLPLMALLSVVSLGLAFVLKQLAG